MKAFMMTAVLTVSVLALPNRECATVEAASKVTVKKVASVNSLTGSKTIKLAKGKKATLKTIVTVTPNKPVNKKVTYKSSNKKIATVSKCGTVKAVKAGKATITVKAADGTGKKAAYKVTVKKNGTPILENTKGNNAADVAALEKIVKEQLARGGKVTQDLDDERRYEWNKKGRLIKIIWSESSMDSISLRAPFSLEGLTALKTFQVFVLE